MATRVFDRPINRSTAVNIAYPVGSIYMSVVNINPETMFNGTTWAKLEDRFLVAAGSTYSAGSTGGSTSDTISCSGTIEGYTLTTNDIPSHTHNLNDHYHDAGNYQTNSAGNHTHRAQGWDEVPRSGTATGLTEVRTRLRDSNRSGLPSDTYGMAASGLHTHTISTGFMLEYTGNTSSYGGGQSHTHGFQGSQKTINTLPPYLPVYMWQRKG